MNGMQVMTQTMQAFADSYTNEKNGRTSYSVNVLQPVNIPVEFSPMKGGNVDEMATVFKKAKADGKQVILDFQNAIDNWGKPKIVVYAVKVFEEKTKA